MEIIPKTSSKDVALNVLINFNNYSAKIIEELRSYIFIRKEIDNASLMESCGNLLHILNEIVNLWGENEKITPFLMK